MVGYELGFVLTAGIFTAVVCGVGTLPFFFVDEINDRLTVILWGFAGGVMLFASLFGFIFEGIQEGTLSEVAVGLLSVGNSSRSYILAQLKPRQSNTMCICFTGQSDATGGNPTVRRYAPQVC